MTLLHRRMHHRTDDEPPQFRGILPDINVKVLCRSLSEMSRSREAKHCQPLGSASSLRLCKAR